MANDKLIQLAKKLQALAQRGVGGEKENAEQMLQRLMSENGITIESIEGEEKKERRIRVKNEDQKSFLHQVIASVVGPNPEIYWYNGYGKREQFIKLTDAQFIEIKTRFEFYWRKLEEERAILYKAFIHKNDLACKVDRSNEPEKELTPQEIEELERMMQMMKSMRRHQHLTRIGDGK